MLLFYTVHRVRRIYHLGVRNAGKLLVTHSFLPAFARVWNNTRFLRPQRAYVFAVFGLFSRGLAFVFLFVTLSQVFCKAVVDQSVTFFWVRASCSGVFRPRRRQSTNILVRIVTCNSEGMRVICVRVRISVAFSVRRLALRLQYFRIWHCIVW